MSDTILVRRRAKRGRPRKDETKARKTMKSIPVFVARDPQGIKLFALKPTLSVLGLWEGPLVDGVKPMDPRTFVSKFRGACLPERGKTVIAARLGI